MRGSERMTVGITCAGGLSTRRACAQRRCEQRCLLPLPAPCPSFDTSKFFNPWTPHG